MKEIIFNSSMPRSGSELLQVLLHQNPKIYGSATSPLLEYQFAARNNYALPEVQAQDSDMMVKAFINMCKSMAEGYYSVITDRPIVCDKNRGWSHYWEWVNQWNPNPKMICMVRDLRSIVASMERIYRETRHLPGGPDDPSNLQNLTVDQRAWHWMNSHPIGLALNRTFDLFQRQLDDKILFVRYEDLCTYPDNTMKTIYEYLELEYYQHDFQNIKKEVKENSELFGHYGRHEVGEKLEGRKLGEWAEVLPKEVAEGIRSKNIWYFERFLY